MNTKILALSLIVLLLTGIWYAKVGREKFSKPVQLVIVKCSRAECGQEFGAKLPFGFDHFPVKCEKCGHASAFVAVTCDKCGAHFPYDAKTPPDKCPSCGASWPY
jgi:DNA-directed RNA polymerase subunit RPC12/RpoP